MIKIFNKFIDYYFSKSLTDKMIYALFIFGLFLTGQGIVQLLFQVWIKKEFGIEIPDTTNLGIILIVGSLIWLYIRIKFQFLPSIFNNIRTTRIIYLQDNKYQFVFDKKMRCAPTIHFVTPYNEQIERITNWDENGFIVKLKKDSTIEKIEFFANAWSGLNLAQKIHILLINLFKKEREKLSKSTYSDEFIKRQRESLKV
jgi:hypothetical protein